MLYKAKSLFVLRTYKWTRNEHVEFSMLNLAVRKLMLINGCVQPILKAKLLNKDTRELNTSSNSIDNKVMY
jgi:hypothetical protein